MAANLQLRLAQAGDFDSTLFLHPANQVIKPVRRVPDFSMTYLQIHRAVPVPVSRHVDSTKQDLSSTEVVGELERAS